MSISDDIDALNDIIDEIKEQGGHIIKHTIVMDSRLRDPLLWPTSMNYALNFEQTLDDQGELQGAEELRRIVAIRLFKGVIHNIYNVFINSSYNGEDEPYLCFHLHEIEGKVLGPTVRRPFATIMPKDAADSNRTFLPLDIQDGLLVFSKDQPYSRRSLGIRIAHMNDETINTTAYDGLTITTSASNFGGSATSTAFTTGTTNHNLAVGDKVIIVVVDSAALKRDIKDRTLEVINVPSNTQFAVSLDSTAIGATPTTNSYMLRHDIQNVFWLELFEARKYG